MTKLFVTKTTDIFLADAGQMKVSNNAGKVTVTTNFNDVISSVDYNEFYSALIKGIECLRDQLEYKFLSPRQSLHYGNTATPGRSLLTTNPNELLSQLNQGNFVPLRSVGGGNKVIVDFGRVIGSHAAGPTQYGVVHINSTGQIHIVPANPFQF